MSYLYAILVVGLFFGVLHYFTELGMKQKMLAMLFVALIVAGAVAFARFKTDQREHIQDIEFRFGQHKTLQCGDLRVNDVNFSYSVGTQSFIGLEDTPQAGRIISAVQCR